MMSVVATGKPPVAGLVWIKLYAAGERQMTAADVAVWKSLAPPADPATMVLIIATIARAAGGRAVPQDEHAAARAGGVVGDRVVGEGQRPAAAEDGPALAAAGGSREAGARRHPAGAADRGVGRERAVR